MEKFSGVCMCICVCVHVHEHMPEFTCLVPKKPRPTSVQFSSVAQSCPTLCNPMNRSTPASLSITNSWSLVKLMSTESVMPSNHLNLCHPLLLPPSIFPSIGVFSNESVLCIRWPKYWSFSFDISPSNEYSGLILQHHSSKAFILLCSAFFIVPTLISIHT